MKVKLCNSLFEVANIREQTDTTGQAKLSERPKRRISVKLTIWLAHLCQFVPGTKSHNWVVSRVKYTTVNTLWWVVVVKSRKSKQLSVIFRKLKMSVSKINTLMRSFLRIVVKLQCFQESFNICIWFKEICGYLDFGCPILDLSEFLKANVKCDFSVVSKNSTG